MLKSEIIAQLRKTGVPKKVEVFVSKPYADREWRTESCTSMSLAFLRAIEKSK